jgi:hypothetical protein
VAHVHQVPSTEFRRAESGEAAQWARRNSVTLVALGLIAVQLWWKALLLGHFYFRQDDFQWQDHALTSKLGWSYLMPVVNGHLMPGGFALVWAITRASLYDWTLASAVDLVLIAASSLALLRLLRTLFGSRPVILIPLAVFSFTPLLLPGLSFWASTMTWLPLQLTTFMAVDAHVRFVRAGKFRWALAATVWIVAGMLFSDVGVLVPFLLLAITSGFLYPGGWPSAVAATLRRQAGAWLAYGVLTAGYLVLFLIQLHASNQHPGRPGETAGVLQFASTALRVSFIPAAFGGPWHWYASGDYALTVETPVLTQLSWVAAVVIILVSMWYRRHAWRAWAILAAWLVAGDFAPVIIARVSQTPGSLLGMDLHYLADSLPALVICLGLAFWPVVGEEDAYRAALPPVPVRLAAACAVLGCFLAGSVWSDNAYVKDTTSTPVSSYIATATAALRQAPAGTVIVSAPVPGAVMDGAIFGSAANTRQVLGPLAPKSARLSWTTSPSGLISDLMVFDTLGRLKQAVVQGPVSSPAPGRRGCYPVTSSGTQIPVKGNLYYWYWTMQLSYSGPSTTLQVQYGRGTHTITVPAGTHSVFLPATGNGSAVVITDTTPGGPPVCVSSLTVGSLQPSRTAIPIPFYPVK